MKNFKSFLLSNALCCFIALGNYSFSSNSSSSSLQGESEEPKLTVTSHNLGIETHALPAQLREAHFDKISSTQTLFYSIVEETQNGSSKQLQRVFGQDKLYEDEVLLISAAEQSAGVGFSGRAWESPIGNVYATFMLPWPDDAKHLYFFAGQVAALSAAETLENCGFMPKVKWPNDVLLDGRKVAGVLPKGQGGSIPFYKRDGTPTVASYDALFVGIGLNVNMDPDLARRRFEATADLLKVPFTSMKIQSEKEYDVSEVLSILKKNVVKNYDLILKNRNFGSDFLPKLSSILAYRGEEVEYREDDNSSPVTLRFLGLGADGRLLFEQNGQEFFKITGRIRSAAN